MEVFEAIKKRRSVRKFMADDSDIKIADDTALGQKLLSLGKQIAFLKNTVSVARSAFIMKS